MQQLPSTISVSNAGNNISPTVSVVMPARNVRRYIEDAVNSILLQSFKDFELIIIDDASTDDTLDYLHSVKDPRIRILSNSANVGFARSVNRGVRLARGRFIARQDADDISLPDRLEKQVAYMESHPEIALLGTPAIIIDSRGAETGLMDVAKGPLGIKWKLLFGNTFVHSSVIIRAPVLDSLECYSECPDLSCVGDYDLWCRIAQSFAVANLCSPLVKWRNHDLSMSARDRELFAQQARGVRARNVCRALGVSEDHSDFVALKRLHFSSPEECGESNARELMRGVFALRKLVRHVFSTQVLMNPGASSEAWHIAKLWARRFLKMGRRGDRAKGVAGRLVLAAGSFWLIAGFLSDWLRAILRRALSGGALKVR